MTAPERKVSKSVTLRHRLGLQPHQRQLERERLRELIQDSEAVNGPAEPTAVEAKRAILRGETEAR